MNPLTEWDQDIAVDLEETYQSLVRALTRTEGFGLFFVRCNEGDRPQLIASIQKDIPQKTVALLPLETAVENGDFYHLVNQFLQDAEKPIDILFITGIEKSLEPYIQPGYGGQGDYYKLDSVPRILGHLNLQRERFRDDFPLCFVFLVSLFALKYFIRRAPDFFDWRSGVFEFVPDSETLAQDTSRLLTGADYEKCLTLTHAERLDKIRDLQSLIDEGHQPDTAKADLLFKQGNIWAADQNLLAAIAVYDQALHFKPDYHAAWNNKGNAFSDLGRKEEAIASYDQALHFKPDYHEAWKNKGNTLSDLGRKEEAIASYDQALIFKPDDHRAWNNKGNTLSALGRYEEAIASYDQALIFKPDDHGAWYNKGNALSTLGRYEEAIASYDQALIFKPDYHTAWYSKGNALSALGRKEEAIASYDQALIFKPDDHRAWNNKGNALSALGRYEEAIASYDQALHFKPDYHTAWHGKGYTLFALGRKEEAIAFYDQALSCQPNFHQAWGNRGIALTALGRYEEAITNYDKVIEIKPDDAFAFYKKACCYALQGDLNNAIDNLQRAIELDPECREMAKTDSDFDNIRDQEAFLRLTG